MKGMIFDIQRNSFVDGPGIRTTVFLKGCNLRCAWCHNPESQSAKPQMLFYRDKCTGCGMCQKVCKTPENCTLCGRCALFCPTDARKTCGREYTVAEVIGEAEKDRAYYENSGGGVTFSGGECMLQLDFLERALRECKRIGLHTAVDTAGFVPFSSFERILPYTDLFLYDIKCFDSQKHREYIGTDNALILENLAKLLKAGANVWIRIPIVPGVNDSAEEMRQIKAFLDTCGGVQKVELLPYHAMGDNKYRALGDQPQQFTVPSAETMRELRDIFA